MQLSADDATANTSDATTSNTVAPSCCSSPHSDHVAPTNTVAPIKIVQQPRPKRQRVYHDNGAAGSSEALLKDCMQSSEWSVAEMMKQRKQFFAEEVEDELERRARQSRLTVPKTCSAGGDDNGDNLEAVDNEVAAAALQRVLKKDDFKRMQVLGQFNLGFVIGKLDNDLFIIDQHASDEKFNYETLQQTTVLHQQPLVRPLPLELTAGEEMVVIDHLDVFAKNGFTFLVDKDAAATKKLKLLSLPFTKHTQFGVEGEVVVVACWCVSLCLFEWLTMPIFGAHTVRYPRARVAPHGRATERSEHPAAKDHGDVRFARVSELYHDRHGAAQGRDAEGGCLAQSTLFVPSRALMVSCLFVVNQIVRNLSGLEQPWNCPHGYEEVARLCAAISIHPCAEVACVCCCFQPPNAPPSLGSASTGRAELMQQAAHKVLHA